MRQVANGRHHMPELTTLPSQASTGDILAAIERDGAVIVEDVLHGAETDQVLAETRPYIDATRDGQDAFAGFRTTRTGALVARSPACRELVLNGTILAAASQFLAPYCKRIQLHLTQIIRLKPGQPAQAIHRDRWAWGTYLKGVEPQFNTIWAVTDFTRENGATQVVPGSSDWPDDRRPEPHEIARAEMRRGSVLLYTGSVFHGGGANVSDEERIGINITYSLAWLRQEENQYLSCPPEIARDLPKALQDLLGYTLGSYALGYYTPPLPPGAGPDVVGAEHALGRTPTGEGLGSDALRSAIGASTRA
jgi:ectoine hydroxylase-related dioxygenase (phytanoyl-CoA dioxygenase family)